MDNAFYSVDIPAMIVAVLAGLACGLCGSLLILKRQTMMADALSHSILPGLVLAYIVTGSTGAAYMIAGAFISCGLAAFLIHLIQTTHIVNSNMAMGIVLTSFFAIGVIALEIWVDNKVHLDTEHALYGAIELIYWPDFGNIKTIPSQILLLGGICILLIITIILAFRRLKLQLSDSGFARSIGKESLFTNMLITVITILVCVSAFEAVGSILVLALIVCPAACANLLTVRFSRHIILSGIIGIICAISGYYLGAILPMQLNYEISLNAAGMIGIMGGVALIISMLLSPLKPR